MPGPPPKPPELRQRRNKVATRATLPSQEVAEAAAEERVTPPLPDRPGPPGEDGAPTVRPWHPMTVAMWEDIWRSPMAGEYLQADLHGLYIMADLVDKYWHAPDQALAAEIRLQRQGFGLSPIDRRRLQWEVERVETAVKKRRPEAPAATAGAPKAEDPRKVLSMVKPA